MPKEKLTVMQKRAKDACEEIVRYGDMNFSVEWCKSNTWGRRPRIMHRGEKAAHASGCGYDKLSAVLVEFLRWLVPDGLPGCSGAGVRTVQNRLKEAGWLLEHLYDGQREDGFRISKIKETT